MSDKIGDFNSLDWNAVDFSKGEWSWGFDVDKGVGEIRHCIENNYFTLTRYPIPDSLLSIIDNLRFGAVADLKEKLRNIKKQESDLLGDVGNEWSQALLECLLR